MGLFDFLFKKNKTTTMNQQKRGYVGTEKIDISTDITDFIAFDLETTGLSADTDKIIEVGFVKISNGQIIDRYNSLIKIGSHIPESATKVNHITDSMLNAQGKEPTVVYQEVVRFIGNALNGSTVLVAHNAKFDTDFLSKELARYGYSGNLKYIDTLAVSRKLIKGLDNYKQPTVANHFNIVNQTEHRAVTDAETCGRIFLNLLEIAEKQEEVEVEKARVRAEKSALDDESKEVGAVLLNILSRSNQDISKIRFYKNSSNYIDVLWVYTIFKYKLAKKGSYIILPTEFLNNIPLDTEDCTKSENGSRFKRVLFNSPFELEQIADVINAVFVHFVEDNSQYDNLSKYERDFFKNAEFTYISSTDIPELIEKAKARDNQKAMDQEEQLEKLKKNEELIAQKEALKKQKAEDKIKNAEERQQKEEERLQLQKELLDNAESYSIETIKQIVELAEASKKRAVMKLDDNNNILKVYISVSEASEEVGIAPKTIRDVANGRYKHGGGFVWKFADEYIKSSSQQLG